MKMAQSFTTEASLEGTGDPRKSDKAGTLLSRRLSEEPVHIHSGRKRRKQLDFLSLQKPESDLRFCPEIAAGRNSADGGLLSDHAGSGAVFFQDFYKKD